MNLFREKNETEEKYLWRIGLAKQNGEIDLDWSEIANIMNAEFRSDETEYRHESAYRKKFASAYSLFSAGVFDKYEDEDARLNEIREAKQELRKEKQKLWDERTALNKTLREQGRRESMADIMKTAIDNYHPISFDYVEKPQRSVSGNDLIIHLTDVHAGVNISSVFNTFNDDVLKTRLHRYLDEIKDIANTYEAENAYVILGGDLLHGIIHLNARLESKENLVQQIMNISDYISNFLYELSLHFNKVEVYSTAGNHSRVLPHKEDNSHGENFDLMIPYVCKKSLQNVANVEIHDNYMDYDIATFKVRGHMIYATHGDKDTPQNVVYHMTQFARKANLPLPDMCYLGHRHKNGLATVDGVKVIESGCIDGMDTFAIDKRLVGEPEQTVTVISEDKLIKALCDIQLN